MVHDRRALDGGPRSESSRAVAPQVGVGVQTLRVWCNRYGPPGPSAIAIEVAILDWVTGWNTRRLHRALGSWRLQQVGATPMNAARGGCRGLQPPLADTWVERDSSQFVVLGPMISRRSADQVTFDAAPVSNATRCVPIYAVRWTWLTMDATSLAQK